MLDELRARFRARFLETARVRLARVRSLASVSDLAGVAAELHCLAGEAALLEYAECARTARLGEHHARAGESRPCKDAVDALERAVAALGS